MCLGSTVCLINKLAVIFSKGFIVENLYNIVHIDNIFLQIVFPIKISYYFIIIISFLFGTR